MLDETLARLTREYLAAVSAFLQAQREAGAATSAAAAAQQRQEQRAAALDMAEHRVLAYVQALPPVTP